MFARFGVRVTVVEALDRLLAMEEPESSALAAPALSADGVEIRTGCRRPASRAHDAEAFTVELDEGTARSPASGCWSPPAGGPASTTSAWRRRARPAGALARRSTTGCAPATASGRSATSPGTGAFTHMAMYEAGVAIRDILGQEGPPADYRALPRVTFTDPEIGAVGLTEAAGPRSEGIAVRTGMADLRSSARGWIHKEGNAGFIKLIADALTTCWSAPPRPARSAARCSAR